MNLSECVFCGEEFTPDVRICPRCHDYRGVQPVLPDQTDLDRRIANHLALPAFYTCAVCEHLHAVCWSGDCRDEGVRWTVDMLDDWYGAEGWREERLEP